MVRWLKEVKMPGPSGLGELSQFWGAKQTGWSSWGGTVMPIGALLLWAWVAEPAAMERERWIKSLETGESLGKNRVSVTIPAVLEHPLVQFAFFWIFVIKSLGLGCALLALVCAQRWPCHWCLVGARGWPRAKAVPTRADAARACWGAEVLGGEMGAVMAIIVRKKNALVEEKRKCLDLPRCCTNLGNCIQSSCGSCSCRATRAQEACSLVALGEGSSSKRFKFSRRAGALCAPHLMLEFWGLIWSCMKSFVMYQCSYQPEKLN